MIEREPFLAWCERTGRRKPAFWERPRTEGTPGTNPVVVLPDVLTDLQLIAPAADPVSAQPDWRDTALPIMNRAILWLDETICAGWSGTFEAWHGEAIDAGIDISQRQFREVWNANATDEMKRPGPKIKNMPDLPPAR
jgi:hypothetical protein